MYDYSGEDPDSGAKLTEWLDLYPAIFPIFDRTPLSNSSSFCLRTLSVQKVPWYYGATRADNPEKMGQEDSISA
jgi:hypothetical protein